MYDFTSLIISVPIIFGGRKDVQNTVKFFLSRDIAFATSAQAYSHSVFLNSLKGGLPYSLQQVFEVVWLLQFWRIFWFLGGWLLLGFGLICFSWQSWHAKLF